MKTKTAQNLNPPKTPIYTTTTTRLQITGKYIFALLMYKDEKMSEYDSLSRDELIRQLEARDWLLNRYRRLADELERDVEFYEESFEDAKDEVYRLRGEE
jgi:hypothetical protein